jgi:Protein of unknown function (DUF 659)/hAT family C-terminal dimerisation region
MTLQVVWKCNYCPQTYVANPTRQAGHLKVCKRFKASRESNGTNDVLGQAAMPMEPQINFPRLNRAQKHVLDLGAALACFMNNLPFNAYENRYTKKFLRDLNAAYRPPTRQAIGGPLLDEIHDSIRARTDVLISNLNHINITTDESTNINVNRISNISIHTKYGSLHYISEDLKAKRMTALAAAEWLHDHLLAISNRQLERVNSISTDTCSTMLRMWAEIEKFDDLKHCLFIPCDAHGIQLLVKDVLTQLPRFNNIMQQAQCIAKSFRLAPLQYARLREYQLGYYGQHQSLVLLVMTRWGTQYRLILSILKNKDALKRYVLEYGSLPASERNKQLAIDAITDKEMWVQLEALRELLQPIDECLRMAESGKSHLGHVLNRWADILKHLRMKSIEHEELHAFISDGAFQERYNRQVLPIHIVAYYLMPATTLHDIHNNSTAIPIGFEEQITKFFNRYASSREQATLMVREFIRFRTQQAPFEPSRQCWQESDDAPLFWQCALGLGPNLGPLAIRIFSAPVNSVASERAFSVQNLIHNKTRNRLQAPKADKLTFVYTNARILDNHDPEPLQRADSDTTDPFFGKRIDNLSLKEEARLEDILLELEPQDNAGAADVRSQNDPEDDEQGDENEAGEDGDV